MKTSLAMLTTLLGSAALCLAIESAADPCPTNKVCISAVGCDTTSNAAWSKEAQFNGGIWALGRYDWVAMTCGARSQLPFYSPSPIAGTVEAHEDFFVTDIAPGTPLVIHASIRVVASAIPAGSTSPANEAKGWLEQAGAGYVEAVASAGPMDPSMSIDEIRSLDFPNVAGEPFRLSMGARSSSREGTGSVEVTLTISGLPPGATLLSCGVGPPLPTRPATWGELKLRYR